MGFTEKLLVLVTADADQAIKKIKELGGVSDTTGKSSASHAAAMPRIAAANWPMISGFSGLPKFMLSVIASGRAPTAVRLRHASATAWAPPTSGSATASRCRTPPS